MGLFIFRTGIVHIIGHNQRNIQFPAHPEQYRIYRFLIRYAMVLHLQEKVAFAETGLIFPGCFFRLIQKPFYDIALHFACQTGRKSDNTFMKLL